MESGWKVIVYTNFSSSDGNERIFSQREILAFADAGLIDGDSASVRFRPAGARRQLWFSHAGRFTTRFSAVWRRCVSDSEHGGFRRICGVVSSAGRSAHERREFRWMRMFLNLVCWEVASGQQVVAAGFPAARTGVVAALKSCSATATAANLFAANWKDSGLQPFASLPTGPAATALPVGEYIIRCGSIFERASANGIEQKEIAAELGFASPAAFWLWRERRRREQSH